MIPFLSSSLWIKTVESISVDSAAGHSHMVALFFFSLFIQYFYVIAGSRTAESPLLRPASSRASHQTRVHPATSLTKSRETPGEAQSDDDDSTTVTSSIRDELLLDCDHLEEACFDSTPAERKRFLAACKGNKDKAEKGLREYLCWRRDHEQIRTEHNIKIKMSVDRDYDLWVESCLVAMKVCGEVADNIVLPRVIRSYQRRQQRESSVHAPSTCAGGDLDLVDRSGHRIFHMIPGLMDDKLAKAETYALAVAIYFDRKLDRESLERVTVCLDVRAGKGWPNIHALRLIPFMKNSLKLLLRTFPERLHKCVVYPVPPAFLYVWTMISKCLDPVTSEKISVVSGKCTISSPPPQEKLVAFLGADPAKLMEDSRVASFKV